MKTLNEQLNARFDSLTEAYRALGGCRSIQDLRRALHAQEPVIKEAERFATSIAHVETREAAAFCDAVRTVRRTLDERKGTLKGVTASDAVQFVTSDTPRKPEPPANALILSRAEARDVQNYERAKAQAATEHRPLWVE